MLGSHRLFLEIDIGERLSAAISYNKARGLFLDSPGRREAAGGAVLADYRRFY
jgi:hypothetical protein